MPYRENISYLLPRDPSIKCWEDRVKLPVPCTKNLIQFGVDDVEKTMGDKIKVYLRLKPSLADNGGVDNLNTYTVLSSTTLQTEAPKDSVSYKNVANGVGKLIHKFSFSSILNQNTSQAALFKKCAVTSLNKFILGENFLLMAYGTTSAGKTYTMQGNVDQPGVIPRALDFVFSSLKENIIPLCRYKPHQYNEFQLLSEEQLWKDLSYKNFILSLDLTKNQRYPDASQVTLQTTASSGFSEAYENMTFKEMQSHLTDTEIFDINSDVYKYGVWISMIEIYNEQVYDLLEVSNNKNEPRPKLMFRDDEMGNTFVKNLRYVNVCSGHEAFQILQFGRTNLHLAPTALNHSSSRSHCIFTITLAKFFDYNSTSHAAMSRYSFCDLAGMERAKKTLNVKDRLVESKAINTSLSILVKCLTTIKENQNSKEAKMIPYRESKLTKLFRDAVTGKEQFSLIVNITTETNLFDETLNVLKFSAIAQKIVPQHVFIKPKVRKLVKKSRFSRIVENHSSSSRTIDWDASTVSYNSSKKDVSESSYTFELRQLQDLVQKLQDDLEKERKRGEQIEADVREELTSKFEVMLRKQNECSRMTLENQVGILEEMYARKEKRIMKYYECMIKNKKRKPDDDDDEGDGVCESETCEEKLKEVEKELQSITSTNEGLKEQLQRLTEEHNKALAECSEFRFIIAEKDRNLEELRKFNEANSAGGDALEIEMRKQLEEAKHKISHFKTLLDEAAADHKELEENNIYLTKENEVLEQYLTEDRDKVEDLTNENSKLQKMLSHKNLMIEKLEEANDKLREELTFNAADQNVEDELKEKINELEKLKDEMEEKTRKMEEIQSHFDALKSENSFLESDLEIYKVKVIDLESKILAVEQNDNNKKEIEFELKISELNAEINKLREAQLQMEEEKNILEEKCNELTSEIQVLQSEMKNLVLQSQKAGEVDSLKWVNEMLVNELSEIKEKKEELEKTIFELTEDLKNQKTLTKDFPEIKEQKNELESKVSQLMEDLKNQKTLEKELSEIKEKKEELEKNVSELMKDMENQKIKAKELLEIKEKKEELEKKVSELMEDMKNQEILEKELSVIKEKNEELETKVSELMEDMRNQKTLEKELCVIKEKKEKLEKKVSELMEDLKEKKRQTENATTFFQEKDEEIKHLNCELESNKKEMENYLETISQLQNRYEELQKELDQKEELIKDLKENQSLINNDKEEIMKLKEKNEELQNKIVILEKLPMPNRNCAFEKETHDVKELENHDSDSVAETEDKNDIAGTDIIQEGQEAKNPSHGDALTPEKLVKQIENLSLQQGKTRSVRKKVDCLDESIHPSTIKKSGRGRKKKKDEENIPKIEANEAEATKKRGKCFKQLFMKNDFDSLSDLNSSTAEFDIPRLRPRK